MKMSPIIPIILAGGTGSRLWPLSRESFPKQYLNLLDRDEYTLLQQTYRRIANLESITKPIIICNEEHRFVVGDQMKKINIDPLEIILEPSGRNTAPAITIAALKASEYFKKKGMDPTLIILSSDHQVERKEEFLETIRASIPEAEKGNLVIFGVKPTHPATGYGYIKSKSEFRKNELIPIQVEKFLEKPDQEKAKLLFKNKKYLWNSGIFVFKASIILEEIKKFSPKIKINCQECLSKSSTDLDFLRLEKNTFEKCANTSIDIAVFEKTSKAFVLPLDCGWNDIGSWDAIWKIAPKDSNGNFIKGKIITKNSKNCYLRSEKRLLATIGIRDLAIIETSDAILISNMAENQKVKDIVNILKKKDIFEGLNHQRIYRPWGHYETIVEDKNWKVKLISVKAGEKLSLQKHQHRSEHWVVVKGEAVVEIDEKEFLLYENQSCYIPKKSKHRLSNLMKSSLSIIEVQCGNYLGEDDIERFKDNYGRTNKS